MKLTRAISSYQLKVFMSRDTMLICLLAIGMTAVVYNHAWVSEDSFITFRYVSNTVDGLGPIFNLGERVQGFTHPLWFILLVLGSLIGVDPIFLSIVYGLIFTFITIGILGFALMQRVPNRHTLVILIAFACLIWGLSDPWVSFQTSGLENSLSNLLITAVLIEAWLHTMDRPGRLLLFIIFLCLTRPDFIIFTTPLLVVLLARKWSLRRFFRLAWATLPAIAWLAFAWAFYGTVLPNTATAKLGIYPNWVEAVRQGLRYLQDWFTYDTIPAVGAVVFLGFAMFEARSKERIACVIGVLLYCIWVVWIGGDFMRGRLLSPILTATVVLGSLTIVDKTRGVRARTWPVETGVAAGLLLVLFFLHEVGPNPGATISEYGIVNERQYYPGYQLRSILKEGRLENPYLDLQLADDLRLFAVKCGQITIHLRNTGTIAYLAGANVSVIDTLGLTDAYIANLPRENLIDSTPRPGHPDKFIPISYLISRHDLAIIPGWTLSVSRGDCTLLSEVAGFQYPSDFYPSP